MSEEVSHTEIGKPVIDSNGERIGTVERVDEGTPLVDREPGLGQTVIQALGWKEVQADVYPIRPPTIETVTSAAIYLRSNL